MASEVQTHNPAEALREVLLPCPFCGGAAKLSNAQCGLDGFPSSYRQPCCTNCDIRMEYMPAREAIAAWNRRAVLTSPAPAGGEADIGKLIRSVVYDRSHEGRITCSPDVMVYLIEQKILPACKSPPPSPDVAGVVERLRERGSTWTPIHRNDAKLDCEAATLLESLSAEKGRLVDLVRNLDDALCAAQEKLQGNPLVLKWVIEIIGDARDRARTALTPKEKA